MIPQIISSATKSRAERLVFDLLRDIDLPDAVALHSVGLSKHEYKRWGELDFVILSPKGLFVLEVKGGGVGCHEGIWTYTDRFGQEHRNSEGPFKQAQSGLMGLKSRLEETVPSGRLSALAFG